MKLSCILFLGLSTVITFAENPVLRRAVYAGPKECDEIDKVKAGDKLGMHYTGTIDESSKTGDPGSKFDSTRDRDRVYEVTIGYGEVIDGWDEGLIGLCKGAQAILVIPPDKAYGAKGAGDIIPGDATLRFDVEVVSVSKPPPVSDLFIELDVDQDGVLTVEEIHAHFRRGDPHAEMPPDLMEKDDTNQDGVVSREEFEFGGPRMPKDMCHEMLFLHSQPNTVGLAIRWICERRDSPVEPKIEERKIEGEL